MNNLLKQLIKYEQFEDLEQLEVFIKMSTPSVIAEELGDIVDSKRIDLEEHYGE